MKVDQNKIEKDWAKRGYSCGLWVDPPGQLWEDYVHDTDELLSIHPRAREAHGGEHRRHHGAVVVWL